MEKDFWSEQMNHEATRLYYEKLKEIVKPELTEIRSYEVLEVGLDVGISARCFLEFPDIKLTSVDSGDVEGGVKNIHDLGFQDRWTFHHVKSDAFFTECKRTFDIIFIDGDHSYEQTKRDIVNSWKFLDPGGLLLGHDYLHKGNFTDNPDYGVHKAFREFLVDENINATIYPPNPGIIAIVKP